MSSVGRGRGYTGRHHMREQRPGEDVDSETIDAARTLAELSPRSTDPTKMEVKEKIEPDEKVTEKSEKSIGDDDITLKDLLRIDEQYVPLLTLLEQFSPGEDGIQFNRKLRHFETTVTSMCPDETRLQQAFGTFRAAALLNSVTARKLAAVGASFTRQQRQQLLRGALLNVVMQGTFSKLEALERSNPLFLINATNLMGDYFAEARLCNGNKVHILASPLLQYMKSLLDSDDIRAHRSLATQLMQNGRELLSVLAPELDELSISIRLRLLSPPPVSTIWLLLSADLCLNKFLPLPNTLQQFYAAHLELTTEESFSEVGYGSWKNTPEKEDYNRSEMAGDADKMSANLSQVSLNNNDDAKPKLRPILGAGAGLLRQEQAFSVSQDNFDTWTSKNCLNKRYDLNSWRQQEEEKKEEVEYNQTALPPNFTVPNYPPPPRYDYQENFVNYLQQGDGAYIQNQYTNVQFNQQGDSFSQYPPERSSAPPITERPPPLVERVNAERALPQMPERVNNELQKNSSRRPVENWRKEKSDSKEDPNRNRPRNWTRQKSKDNINDDDDKEKYKERSVSRNSRDTRPGRINRRNSGEDSNGTTNGTSGNTPPRRHVTEVPRSAKYWDHDDRCDKDYNS